MSPLHGNRLWQVLDGEPAIIARVSVRRGDPRVVMALDHRESPPARWDADAGVGEKVAELVEGAWG